jgi:glycosyltransferase involved in cell wall biosynthesis
VLADRERLRIALVGPVAQSIPPARSGSVESVTALLADGLVGRSHEVTLFAAGTSNTRAKLHALFPRGYHEDPDLWPWEICELLNLSAAVERASEFDVIHYQAPYAPLSLAFAGLSRVPVVTTVHHAPAPSEVALWSRSTRTGSSPFIAVSEAQRSLLAGVDVVATIHHAVDVDALGPHGAPEDQLLFLGRFTEGKGVLEAIDVARRARLKLVLAAAANEYFERVVSQHVDGERVVWAGELGYAEKAALLARSRALLYPVQSPESFGLVMPEAMACGTPVAALRRGAVEEIVEDGVTGGVFESVDDLLAGLPRVLALDRARVRARAVERFGPERMVDAHVRAYTSVVARTRSAAR